VLQPLARSKNTSRHATGKQLLVRGFDSCPVSTGIVHILFRNV
jgi:hypothetical protein